MLRLLYRNDWWTHGQSQSQVKDPAQVLPVRICCYHLSAISKHRSSHDNLSCVLNLTQTLADPSRISTVVWLECPSYLHRRKEMRRCRKNELNLVKTTAVVACSCTQESDWVGDGDGSGQGEGEVKWVKTAALKYVLSNFLFSRVVFRTISNRIISSSGGQLTRPRQHLKQLHWKLQNGETKV